MSNPFSVAKKYLDPDPVIDPIDDPILPPVVWLPVFHEWRCNLTPYPPDYGYLRQYNPELYRKLKVVERKIDGLYEARLSQVMEILGEWRRLLLEATGR